jgi:hypothetical protein
MGEQAVFSKNLCGISSYEPRDDLSAICSLSGRKQIKHTRRQQILKFAVGTFAVVNASQSLGLLGEYNFFQDITLTAAPSAAGRIEIYGVDQAGRLRGGGEVALVRVLSEEGQLFLGYDVLEIPGDNHPEIVVRKISTPSERMALEVIGPTLQEPCVKTNQNIQVHFPTCDDVNAQFFGGAGSNDNRSCIEGFSICPWEGLTDKDIMYRAIIGERWESPWHFGGTYCGTRGLDFPINGVRVKLSEAAAAMYHLTYSGIFLDGTVVGPMDLGEKCACGDYQAMTGLRIIVERRPA